MKPTKEDIARARESFAHLKPGDTVYTILRHVSRSGMRREVSVVVFQDGHAYHPNYSAAVLIGAPLNRSGSRDAIIRNGCGYDVCADTVGNLSYALFGDFSALRHEDL